MKSETSAGTSADQQARTAQEARQAHSGQPLRREGQMSSLIEGFQCWKVQIARCFEPVQLQQDLSDLANARVLVPIVGHGLPERDSPAIDNDGLVNIDGADTRISDRL